MLTGRKMDSSNAAEREAAATKIQSRARGIQARKEVATLREEQSRTEHVAIDQLHTGVSDMAVREAAATKIQSRARGIQARKEVATLREEKSRAEHAVVDQPLMGVPDGTASYTDEEVEAVIIIQAAQRARVARKEVAQIRRYQEELNVAATKIQKVHRGAFGRRLFLAFRIIGSIDVANPYTQIS